MTEAILVFAHLRWNFVYQRPQHLLTRLARNRRIIYFEEPVVDPNSFDLFLQCTAPEANVLVCTPHTPARKTGYHDEQIPYLTLLLKRLLASEQVRDYVVWFYTPMALPLVQALDPRAIVYDCMDELSGFLHAPRQLLQRETALLKTADLVFTGGPSLYRAKKDLHPDVHCFSSSVDAVHFAKARGSGHEPALQQDLAQPRLGFFGVIDERCDLPLVDTLAQTHPEWQTVLVGPVVKIDPATLPRQANLHYFGQQAYADLPDFLRGWDVCLIPFALNDATRFISPTETLEYMAAEKPVVSTPITDVAEPYGDIVCIGATAEAFIAGCERALAETADARRQRRASMRRVLAQTSWDSTVQKMEDHLARVLAAKGGKSAPRARITTPPAADARLPHIVVGAGPTGLSAAYHLGGNVLLLEQHATTGGWCRSVVDKGFTFDYAGHIMFSSDPYVHQLYAQLLGDNVHWQEREAWIYSQQTYTRYPFQGALYGLPPAVIKECLVGAIEARFGNIRQNRSGEEAGDHQILPFGRREEPRNFEEFIYQVWGAGIARHFAIPYNRKLWGLPLKEMETSWLGGRVPLPDLEEMIDGALHPVPKPNARFGYPLRGGFQALLDGFLPHLQGKVRPNARVVAVSPAHRTVTIADGTSYRYETLTSTMPLPELVRMLGREAPGEVRRAAAGLRHLSIRNVNIGVARADVTEKHWIYLPEEPVCHRIFVQGNASPHVNPPGGFGLTCEISYSDRKPLPGAGEELIERCIADCVRMGLLRPDDRIVTANELDMPYAYVIYDHARAQNVATIRSWLERQGIFPAGRYGEWQYYNSDHALLAGRDAAEKVRQYATQPQRGGKEARRAKRKS